MSLNGGAAATATAAVTTVSVLLLLLIIPSAATGAVTPRNHGKRKMGVPAMFVFGDSQLDAGNNLYIKNSSTVINFPPYGETYFHKPTGRFSNGRTIADFFAQSLGLPLLPPSLRPGISYLRGVNFASGGSGLLDSTSSDLGVLSMNEQSRQFQNTVKTLRLQLGEIASKKLLSESLYIIATGSNDFGLNYMQNASLRQSIKPQEFVAMLINEYKTTIQSLYDNGARKIAVFELGVLGCTPYSRFIQSQLNNQTGGCLSELNQLGQLFNTALSELVLGSKKLPPDLKLTYGKTFSIVTDIMQNAQAYGFHNTTNACCGAGPFNAAINCGRPVPPQLGYQVFKGKRPTRFLFWDNTHPTEAAYHHVFKKFWEGGKSAIEPYNIVKLVTL